MKCVKECLYIVILTIVIGIPTIYSKQYRKDYVYNDVTDAFYKFHIEASWFNQANAICKLEGASVIVPKSDHDVSQVHGMFKQYPDIKNLIWIGNDGNTYESVEENPIINLDDNGDSPEYASVSHKCDVMSRDGDVKAAFCYTRLPFVCKVNAQDAVYDGRCRVYGSGYKYFEASGSCYKVPRLPYSWNQAYDECQNEGSHLAVLNSESERQVIHTFVNAEQSVPGAQATYFFFVGIRAEKKTDGSPVVFKTIFNQTLVAAGFNTWTVNEPNNYGNNEYCGTIFITDAKYNDVDCSHYYAFICENEVKA